MITTWPSIRTGLKALIESLLSLPEGAVYWSSDRAPMCDTQVRLTVLSDVPETDARREETDAPALRATRSHRLAIEVMIETTVGEANGDTSEDAHTMANTLTLSLELAPAREALLAAGLALVMAPGAVRVHDFHDREASFSICARSFELPLRANFRYEVPLDEPTGEITRVIGEGAGIEYDVSKP